MVWFYPFYLAPVNKSLYPFQSHYGLILSLNATNAKILAECYFQSHYGLILSCSDGGSVLQYNKSFNPTMVWFYHVDEDEEDTVEVSFQSHYGLILSAYKIDYGKFNVETFNPTMVWFYQRATGELIRGWRPFNPTMVWFYRCTAALRVHCAGKLSIPLWSDFITRHRQAARHRAQLSIPLWSDFIGLHKKRLGEPLTAFNPTMVWFYRWSMTDNESSSYVFQSHYGLILSWAKGENIKLLFISFQSHYGLILSPTTSTEERAKRVAFNPTMVWFYPHPVWLERLPARNFQSHYGLILSIHPCYRSAARRCPFNPTMVWFYPCREKQWEALT